MSVYIPPPAPRYGRWPRRIINATLATLCALMGALVLIGYFS